MIRIKVKTVKALKGLAQIAIIVFILGFFMSIGSMIAHKTFRDTGRESKIELIHAGPGWECEQQAQRPEGE